MHVIWKRPDGFHNASPSDYQVVELEGHSRLWLHKDDKDSFPFRISGGWEEEDATVKLNNLVNLLSLPEKAWIDCLKERYSHSTKDDAAKFFADISEWLQGLTQHLKGDSWEVEIMEQAINLTHKRLIGVKGHFGSTES
jgi:hypothetical protein